MATMPADDQVPSDRKATHLVLVGAGHTHLHVLDKFVEYNAQGRGDRLDVTLISPFPHSAYSGMLPGTLAGLYQPDEMLIDLHRLTRRAGVRLVIDKAVGLDLAPGPNSRAPVGHVQLASGHPIDFHIASIGIGSIPAGSSVIDQHPAVVAVKPMQTFLGRFQHAVSRFDDRPDRLRIVVVGAGAAGFEVACGLNRRLKSENRDFGMTIVDSGDRILYESNRRASTLATRAVEHLGIGVRLNTKVAGIADAPESALTTPDRDTIPCDIAVWVTGAAAPPALESFDLPKTPAGFLEVDDTLKTTADLPVFVVGDTASFQNRQVPKAGVYAVREGPVLWHNLLAGSKSELRPFEPQTRFLRLYSSGDRRAIFEYGPFAFHSRWAWWLKDAIDRRFVRRYQK